MFRFFIADILIYLIGVKKQLPTDVYIMGRAGDPMINRMK